MELVDALAAVDTVTATTAASGGADAETDDAYLDRLAEELELLAPRPILPQDFAVLARRVTGVHRALAIDTYIAGTNEVQTVNVTDATGGTFTLTFDGQTTAPIAFDATAAAVVAALEALANIAPGDVAGARGPLGVDLVEVTFSGAYLYTNVSQLVADGTALTGAGAVVTTSTATAGVPAQTNVPRTVTVAVVDADGTPVPQTVKDELVAELESHREVNFQVFVTDPSYTPVSVDVTFTAEEGYEIAALEASVAAALADYLDPGNWGGGDLSPPEWRVGTNVVRLFEVASLVNAVPGVDYVVTLTLNGVEDDVTLTGAAPLPSVGAITAAVV